MENQFKMDKIEHAKEITVEKKVELKNETNTEPEVFDLHDPELWEDLKKLEEEDYVAYLKKIDQIVKQQELHFQHLPEAINISEEGHLESQTEKDNPELNIDDLYSQNDESFDLYGKYANYKVENKKEVNSSKNFKKGINWEDLR